MTVEQGEIPTEYVWIDLPGINARLPMPEKWFFLGFETPDTLLSMPVIGPYLYQISRESILRKGIFTTGVAVHAFTRYSQVMKGTPVDFAKGFLKRLPVWKPVGEITEIEDDPLVICRRRFILPVERWVTIPTFHAELVTKYMPPSHFYYLAAGNRDTDTAYIAWFETPSVKWKDDRQIAETMINNLSFDKNF